MVSQVMIRNVDQAVIVEFEADVRVEVRLIGASICLTVSLVAINVQRNGIP